jgi:hypothetical protein
MHVGFERGTDILQLDVALSQGMFIVTGAFNHRI